MRQSPMVEYIHPTLVEVQNLSKDMCQEIMDRAKPALAWVKKFVKQSPSSGRFKTTIRPVITDNIGNRQFGYTVRINIAEYNRLVNNNLIPDYEQN